jgi:branched-chain amino acid transport system substrate-binding protein
MRKSSYLHAAALAAALTAAAFVTASAQTIKIGVFGPMAGDAAAMGQTEKEGAELAIKEKNDAGGIRGKQIEAIYADDGGKPEEAVNVAKRLISRDGVVITIGSITSPASLAAAQVSRQSEVPQIVVSGTAQRITTQGNKWVFRSSVPDTKLAGDLVEFIHEKFPKLKKFAFLYVNDDFGRGGFEAFKAAGQKYGFETVADERYTRGDIDFTAQLGHIKASPAEALIEWSRYAEGALIAKQFVQTGLKLVRFGSDGFASPKYIELGGPAVNGVYYTSHFSVATSEGIPAARAFMEKYQKMFGKVPDAYAAEAYDAVKLAIAAIEKAGSENPAAIRDALANEKMESVRGPFAFDAKGDPVLVTHIVKVVDGKETNARNEPVQN